MSRMTLAPRLGAFAPALVLLTLGGSVPASAVPVFARKYQTSCQTCHTIFPKLNAFGEAFRLNGYRMPGETEETVKEKPVALGAEAQKRVFPAMLYPSTLPGNAPFALNVKMASLWTSTHDESGTVTVKNDFQFPQEANLFSAGTLGDTFGFLGEITFGENPDGSTEVEIEHARFDVTSPFGPPHLFNFRIGKLAPNLYDGFQEMWIMTDNAIDSLFAYSPIGYRGGTGIGDSGISLPDRVRGIEMYGVGKHRIFYTVGMAQPILGGGPNGSFSANGKVDVYGRLDYKFGGMGLDGDTTGITLPPENWREKSLRLGVLGYSGNGSGVGYDVTDDAGNPFAMEDRRYNRAGVFASFYYQDLNVFGVFLHGSDRLALSTADTGDALGETTRSFDAWFVQADYVFKPPFQASLRYESLKPADMTVATQHFLDANFSYLWRANIKPMIEYHVDLKDSKNYELAALLRFAM